MISTLAVIGVTVGAVSGLASLALLPLVPLACVRPRRPNRPRGRCEGPAPGPRSKPAGEAEPLCAELVERSSTPMSDWGQS
jgi:hypothetical protein